MDREPLGIWTNYHSRVWTDHHSDYGQTNTQDIDIQPLRIWTGNHFRYTQTTT